MRTLNQARHQHQPQLLPRADPTQLPPQTAALRRDRQTAAAEINRQHAGAQSHAKLAVEYAIRCGGLLLEQKERVAHGEFMSWITKHCTFKYSTAARYMKAAEQSSTGVEISALRTLFDSGRPEPKKTVTSEKNDRIGSDESGDRTPTRYPSTPGNVHSGEQGTQLAVVPARPGGEFVPLISTPANVTHKSKRPDRAGDHHDHGEHVDHEDPVLTYAELRQEITRRRAANKAERAKRNWNVDATLKVELVHLLDWIEEELDKMAGAS